MATFKMHNSKEKYTVTNILISQNIFPKNEQNWKKSRKLKGGRIVKHELKPKCFICDIALEGGNKKKGIKLLYLYLCIFLIEII